MQKSAKDPAKEGATEELKNQLRKVQKWAEDPAKEGVAKEQSGVQVIYHQKKRIINSTTKPPPPAWNDYELTRINNYVGI